MGWTAREVERDRDVLERILALLLALAGLADRASGLPASRRLDVLCFLAYGEAEARAFVTGMAFGPSGEGADTASPAADDAARLAASFRALALVLGAILARAEMRGQFTCFPCDFRTCRGYHWKHVNCPRISPSTTPHVARHGGEGTASGFEITLTRLGLRPRHPLPEGRGGRRPRLRALFSPAGEKVASRSEAG